jgi:hypothetical protein
LIVSHSTPPPLITFSSPSEIKYLNLEMVNESKVMMEVAPTLEAAIREGQLEDAKLKDIRQLIRDNKTNNFSEDG